MAPSPDAHLQREVGPFHPDRRALTIGILLGVTLVGFETLAVVTVAPAIAGSFAAVARYGWIFSSFLLATLLGSVVGGWALDRIEPRLTLLAALTLFGAGLLVAAVAGTMDVLLAARALQGLGGGALVTALYVAVTRAYPDRARPRMMALMSSAWILPALLGPTVAGAVATAFGWRSVFYGLLPIVAVVILLTLPGFATLQRGAAAGSFRARINAALLLVGGALLLLAGLESGTLQGWAAVAAGSVAAQRALTTLLPDGTLRLRRGLAAAIGARGSIYPAFVTAETMVSLMLIEHFAYSPAVGGAILAAGSLSWTAGAWLQERLDARSGSASRGPRIAIGAALVTTGLAVQILALVVPPWALVFAACGWAVAGAGIGMAHATTSVHAFALAGPDGAGSASAALQIVDQFGAAIGTGVAGAIFAASLDTGLGASGGIAVALALSAGFAALGVVGGMRSRPHGLPHDPHHAPPV